MRVYRIKRTLPNGSVQYYKTYYSFTDKEKGAKIWTKPGYCQTQIRKWIRYAGNASTEGARQKYKDRFEQCTVESMELEPTETFTCEEFIAQ